MDFYSIYFICAGDASVASQEQMMTRQNESYRPRCKVFKYFVIYGTGLLGHWSTKLNIVILKRQLSKKKKKKYRKKAEFYMWNPWTFFKFISHTIQGHEGHDNLGGVNYKKILSYIRKHIILYLYTFIAGDFFFGPLRCRTRRHRISAARETASREVLPRHVETEITCCCVDTFSLLKEQRRLSEKDLTLILL